MATIENSAETLGVVSLRTIFRDLLSARELIWRLCARDLAVTYKQSFLGYLWAIAPPVATVVLFTFLSRSRVIAVGQTALPYPAYVMLSLTVWAVFATTVMQITSCLTRSANLLHKMRFPREVLVISAVGQGLVDIAIRAALFLAVAMVYQAGLSWAVVLIPLMLIPLVLFTIGVGCMLAVVNALVRDVSSALPVVLQFGMLLTPVVYPPPADWPYRLINYVNPVSQYVIAAQDLAATGGLSSPGPLAVSALVSAVVFMTGLYVFRLAQPLVAERI